MEYVIAVDAMGGDNAPEEIVKGVIVSLQDENLKILLLGREEAIEPILNKETYDKNRIELIHCTDIITNDEQPTVAIKQKKNSSIVVGLNLVKEGKAMAFVSAGSTGAILTGATVIVGRIKGIERPALATLLPNKNGFSFLIDCGANVDAKPSYLAQFAEMGSIYMENMLSIKNPKVGLVNVGTEKGKGNLLTKEAYGLLEHSSLNFIGNLEARDIPYGMADVIVCDAFVGNVILKYSEGFADTLLGMIKKELMSTTISKLGAMMSKSAFSNLKKSFDYSEIGGAPFLGLKALVVKAHGSTNAKGIKGAVNQCKAFIANDIVNKIASGIKDLC